MLLFWICYSSKNLFKKYHAAKILSHTTVFNIDNRKYYLSSKSAYWNDFWSIIVTLYVTILTFFSELHDINSQVRVRFVVIDSDFITCNCEGSNPWKLCNWISILFSWTQTETTHLYPLVAWHPGTAVSIGERKNALRCSHICDISVIFVYCQ